MVIEIKSDREAMLSESAPDIIDVNVAGDDASASAEAARTRIFLACSYVFCCLVWSTTYWVVRQTVLPTAGLAPYYTATMRFLIAVAIFVPVWLIFARKDRLPTKREFFYIATAGVLNAFNQVCVYSSEQEICGGLAAVLAATTPLMVALIAMATKTEKVSGRTMIGFVACFIGVALVCHDRLQVSMAQAFAAALMLASSFFNACANVTLKRASTGLNPIISATIFLAVTAIPIWVASLIRGEPQFEPIPTQPFMGIIYLAVMSSFVAFGLYLYMLKHLKLMTIATLPFVIPVLALVVDLFLEKQFVMTTESWIGCFVVLAGVVYSILRR
ncbi:MAG: DMT family transporter [Cyanobacteria bacterium SZAS LIN-5]|nr:DMT family transporter [Cyanobacteria bacterium SZAS LIN-5]